MTDVGQIERNTQNRIVKLFVERLGYDYLGDWYNMAEMGGTMTSEIATCSTCASCCQGAVDLHASI